MKFIAKYLLTKEFKEIFLASHKVSVCGDKQSSDLPGANKSLVRPGRKQARKHVREGRDFNNIETRAVIKSFFFLQGKAPKDIHAILTETLPCPLPGRAKDLSAPLVTWKDDLNHQCLRFYTLYPCGYE